MKRILIVEDDPIIGRIYRACLEKAGHQVEIATDGQSCLDQVLKFKPDGLLLDLMLPRINGLELLKRMRAAPAFQHLPIIVCTNACVPELLQGARQAGATAVFDKSSLTHHELAEAFGCGNSPRSKTR